MSPQFHPLTLEGNETFLLYRSLDEIRQVKEIEYEITHCDEVLHEIATLSRLIGKVLGLMINDRACPSMN